MKTLGQDITTGQEFPDTQSSFSALAEETVFVHPDIAHPVVQFSVLQKTRKERTNMAVNEMCIGKRIQDELKRQGRTVAWLARQLCVQRSSLYYLFRQNSIDMEQLVRISSLLNHNFLQDVTDVYKAYGL